MGDQINVNNNFGNGDIYNLNGPLTINHFKQEKPAKASWLGTTESLLTITSGLLTIFIFIASQMGGKPEVKAESNVSNTAHTDSLVLVSGIVLIRGSQTGIPGAIVKSNLIPSDSVITTSDGTFQFEVNGLRGSNIRVEASAEHYITRNEYGVLGLPIQIQLDPK